MGCFATGNQKEVSGAALYFMEILFQHLDLAGCGILSISTGRTKMPDEPPSPTLDTELTTNIVAAYVRSTRSWRKGDSNSNTEVQFYLSHDTAPMDCASARKRNFFYLTGADFRKERRPIPERSRSTSLHRFDAV